MTSARLFFGSNIRFLRERRKLTQEDFAEQLGFTRVKLAAIEAGRTENPSAVDLIKFSDFFGLSIDNLFRLDLRRVGELPLRELEAGNQLYMKGTNLRVLAISTDKANKENVEYVPVKAKAGYRSGYANPEFIASLPKFSVPGLPQTGTFRMFPTTGDSMLPVPEGADDAVGFEPERTLLDKAKAVINFEKGSIKVLEMCFEAVRRMGTVSIMGVYGSPYDNFPLHRIFDKGITIRQGQAPVLNYIDHLIDLVKEEKVVLDDIITHTLPLEEATRGYKVFNDKEEDCVKVVLKPW